MLKSTASVDNEHLLRRKVEFKKLCITKYGKQAEFACNILYLQSSFFIKIQ